MALADIRTKDMDASVAAAGAAGLAEQLRLVAEGLGLGGLGWLARTTWRASARVTRIEVAQAAQEKINAEMKAALDALAASHGKLEIAVAKLPTRDEETEMFRELRQDVRDLRVRRRKTVPDS